jgi:hypothetical protein
MVKKKLSKNKKNFSKKTLGGGKKNIVSSKLSPMKKMSRKRFKIKKRKTEKKMNAKMKGGKKRSRKQRGGAAASMPPFGPGSKSHLAMIEAAKAAKQQPRVTSESATDAAMVPAAMDDLLPGATSSFVQPTSVVTITKEEVEDYLLDYYKSRKHNISETAIKRIQPVNRDFYSGNGKKGRLSKCFFDETSTDYDETRFFENEIARLEEAFKKIDFTRLDDRLKKAFEKINFTSLDVSNLNDICCAYCSCHLGFLSVCINTTKSQQHNRVSENIKEVLTDKRSIGYSVIDNSSFKLPAKDKIHYSHYMDYRLEGIGVINYETPETGNLGIAIDELLFLGTVIAANQDGTHDIIRVMDNKRKPAKTDELYSGFNLVRTLINSMFIHLLFKKKVFYSAKEIIVLFELIQRQPDDFLHYDVLEQTVKPNSADTFFKNRFIKLLIKLNLVSAEPQIELPMGIINNKLMSRFELDGAYSNRILSMGIINDTQLLTQKLDRNDFATTANVQRWAQNILVESNQEQEQEQEKDHLLKIVGTDITEAEKATKLVEDEEFKIFCGKMPKQEVNQERFKLPFSMFYPVPCIYISHDAAVSANNDEGAAASPANNARNILSRGLIMTITEKQQVYFTVVPDNPDLYKDESQWITFELIDELSPSSNNKKRNLQLFSAKDVVANCNIHFKKCLHCQKIVENYETKSIDGNWVDFTDLHNVVGCHISAALRLLKIIPDRLYSLGASLNPTQLDDYTPCTAVVVASEDGFSRLSAITELYYGHNYAVPHKLEEKYLLFTPPKSYLEKNNLLPCFWTLTNCLQQLAEYIPSYQSEAMEATSIDRLKEMQLSRQVGRVENEETDVMLVGTRPLMPELDNKKLEGIIITHLNEKHIECDINEDFIEIKFILLTYSSNGETIEIIKLENIKLDTLGIDAYAEKKYKITDLTNEIISGILHDLHYKKIEQDAEDIFFFIKKEVDNVFFSLKEYLQGNRKASFNLSSYNRMEPEEADRHMLISKLTQEIGKSECISFVITKRDRTHIQSLTQKQKQKIRLYNKKTAKIMGYNPPVEATNVTLSPKKNRGVIIHSTEHNPELEPGKRKRKPSNDNDEVSAKTPRFIPKEILSSMSREEMKKQVQILLEAIQEKK